MIALAAAPAGAETVNKILATVDGDPITVYEITRFMTERSRGAPIPEGVKPESPQVLEAYITEKLIQKEISDQGIVVTDADVDRQLEAVRAQNRINQEQLKQAVEMQGMTWEQYRGQVREELQKAGLINKEIRGKVNVTPEEVRRYYEKHKGEFVAPGTQVKVRHVLFSLPAGATQEQIDEAMARAADLRKGIDDADDFAKVAKDVNDDDSGGDLGYINPDSMQEDLADAVRDLDQGEVSEPIHSGPGVHLVMVEDIREESDTPIDSYSEQIKEKLYKEALEERYERWIREDLRLRHYVDIRP